MTDLDRLIDAAARDLTAAPSPVDLRARVVEEIRRTTLQAGHIDEAKALHKDEAKASYHMWWLAAAAGVILAVYLAWPARPEIATVPPPVVKVVEPELPTWRLPPPQPTPRTQLRRAPAPRRSDPAIASVPALDAPAAIGIAPLDRTPGSLPALDAVEPLDVEQLDIKPLTPPGPAAGGQ